MTLSFKKKSADIFIPSGQDAEKVLQSVTHLAIGAHQDDIEIMAYHGILHGLDNPVPTFAAVTCTNGAGSPRTGSFARYTDEQMQQVRKEEQRQAASIGRYALMAQLDYPSSEIKDPNNMSAVDDLVSIMASCKLDTVYTHNPADKHETHLGVVSAVVAAVRKLPKDNRPKRLLGCEVWRDLDWLPDEKKVVLNVSGRENLAAALVGVFDSQIAGGKRYDLATFGRRLANATFFQSHSVDNATHVTVAMDLSPLIDDTETSITDYVQVLVDMFKSSVLTKMQQFERK